MCVCEGVGRWGGWHVQCAYVCVHVRVLAGEGGARAPGLNSFLDQNNRVQTRTQGSQLCLGLHLSESNVFFLFRAINSLWLLCICFLFYWYLTDSWPWSSCKVTRCLQIEAAPDFRLHWLPLQFVSLLFWTACWPVGPLVSWLDIVGLCAIRCSVNVLIKLSVLCNVLEHLPSAEPVLLLLLLHFNCFYFTALKLLHSLKKDKKVCLWMFIYVLMFGTCCDHYDCSRMELNLVLLFQISVTFYGVSGFILFSSKCPFRFFSYWPVYFSKMFYCLFTVCNYSVSFSSILEKIINLTGHFQFCIKCESVH